MRQFTVTTEGQNRLGLRELCHQFADQWVAVHLPADQAAESVLREFKRAVRAELELLEVRCQDAGDKSMRQTLHDSIRHQLVHAAHQIDDLRKISPRAESQAAAERAVECIRQALAALIDVEAELQ